MTSMAIRQVVNVVHHRNVKISPSAIHKPNSPSFISHYNNVQFLASHRRQKSNLVAVPNASPSPPPSGIVDDEEGVSLGTMKLPSDIDVARFETLLFQWGNSLCQGANLPLPVPLKVDKIRGGARLGFITVGDEETQVLVYIDCLVFPATDNSAPLFRAIRNGPKKDEAAPGEPRIMTSLLQALKRCVQIARQV